VILLPLLLILTLFESISLNATIQEIRRVSQEKRALQAFYIAGILGALFIGDATTTDSTPELDLRANARIYYSREALLKIPQIGTFSVLSWKNGD